MKILFSSIFGKKKNKIEESVQPKIQAESVKVEPKSFEGYRMTVDFESETSEKYYPQPTSQMVDEVIDQMSKELVNFVVVEHSKSVGGCVFVQCMWGGDGVYQVEAQVRRSTPEGVLRSQYRLFSENVNEVKNLFAEFLAGQAPNIKDWEYMDDFDFYEE
ncbi:MAG: hypothetical protein K2I23_06565 [Clostridia bacterium]|nr:hypothetical protein [Clostridia bacterium]